jgi:hypothetical protein
MKQLSFQLLTFFFHLYNCLDPVRGTSTERFQCLQRPLGPPPGGTINQSHWKKGRIRVPSPPISEIDFEWIYDNEDCPLRPINLTVFCKTSMGCGKHMLIVGDSTSSSLIDFWETMLPHTSKRFECSTPNHCPEHPGHQKGSQRIGCHDDHGIVSRHREMHICKDECPGAPTIATFIRHDFLIGVHGEWYFKSGVCDEWWQRARNVDYVVLSFGPHISAMKSHPNLKPATADFNMSQFLESTATEVARRLETTLKPHATVIFRTAHHGARNFSADCAEMPAEVPPVPEDVFAWDSIPLSNRIYIDTFTRELTRKLLVVNSENLMNSRRGCRGDSLHFNVKSWQSPVAMDWQLLQNVLEAHQQEQVPTRYRKRQRRLLRK